jgi:tRNA dimethylallyltransferase
MQLYRGMDVGTAKLPMAQRCGVPHHLLDVWEVTRAASVADFQRRARDCIEALLARGVTPVLVGGSGLYVRAVLDPIEFPGTDAALRRDLEDDLATLGPQRMHARLAGIDPAAAAAIAPANGRKVVRALEVVALTGRPFTSALPPYDQPRYDAVQVGLDLSTPALDARVARRVDAMLADGLVEEVRRLESVGLRAGFTASRALGYAQVFAALDGRLPMAEVGSEIARVTRRFVRRQRSWFRRDPRIRWIEASAGAGEAVEEVVALATG